MKGLLLSIGSFFCFVLPAQNFSTSAEFEAKVVGGSEQLNQVLQTQLTLPKSVLTSNFDEHINLFFDLDSAGHAVNLKLSKGMNNLLRLELVRILRFLTFSKTQSSLYETQPYFLTLHLSTSIYNNYYKQRSKLNLKKPLPADSTYIIHVRADRSPEYYKGGDEGLGEFMLSELEYPKLAKEKSIEGTVVIEFVVETNGYVTGLVVKQGVNGGCTEEALRLIALTKWQPAVMNNKFVRYKTNYPVTFSLRNTTREGTGTVGQ